MDASGVNIKDMEKMSLHDNYLIIIDVLKGNLHFYFSPIFDISNYFQMVQSIENIIVVFFLILLFIDLIQKNIFKCLYWYISLLFASGLYGMVVFNTGSLVRYKFSIIISLCIAMIYDLNLDQKKIK